MYQKRERGVSRASQKVAVKNTETAKKRGKRLGSVMVSALHRSVVKWVLGCVNAREFTQPRAHPKYNCSSCIGSKFPLASLGILKRERKCIRRPFAELKNECDRQSTGACEKVSAKFGEESSVWADGLCIGCLSQWSAARRKNSNMQ